MTDYIDWLLGLDEEEEENTGYIARLEEPLRLGKRKRRGDPDAVEDTAPPVPLWGGGTWGRLALAAQTAKTGIFRETAAAGVDRRAVGVDWLAAAVTVGPVDDGGQGVISGVVGVDALGLVVHRPGGAVPMGGEAAGRADLFEGLQARRREAQWADLSARRADFIGPIEARGDTPRALTPGQLDAFFQRDARRYDNGWQEAVW